VTDEQEIKRSKDQEFGGKTASQLVHSITAGSTQQLRVSPSFQHFTQQIGPVPDLAEWFNMVSITADFELLTNKIIACAIEVHKTLGPGLLESVYQECMAVELKSANLDAESDRRVPIKYKGQRIRSELKLDLLVGGSVVVELKAVEQIHPVYLAQVITYLKLTGCPAGLLINFNNTSLKSGLRRLNHPDVYKQKQH
jgi:GxxExxY protein